MAIAAIVEIVPTKYRGYHIIIVVASFLPFAPASSSGALIPTGDILGIRPLPYGFCNTAWAPLTISLLGIGAVLIPNQIILTAIYPDHLIATATCLTASLCAVGHVIGTRIFYTQFVSVLTAGKYERVVPVAMEVGLALTDLRIVEFMMPVLVATPWKEWMGAVRVSAVVGAEKLGVLREVVIGAFAMALNRICYISIVFEVVAVGASLFIEDSEMVMDLRVVVHYFGGSG
ncbi:hypothetical protein BJX76DRAFT_361460 [Aspergillus varians]